jgi:hypothetical protein
MIFSFLIIHNHDRMSSITRVLRSTTWKFFTKRLRDYFMRSPNVVKEEIMTDINDFVQEFWTTSSDGAVEASFFAMRRLLEILERCFGFLDVCFVIISFSATAVELADKNLQWSTDPDSWQYRDQPLDALISIGDKFKLLFDGYRKMTDHSFSKSKYLGDMLRFLPGVVVQEPLSMQGMAVLYRIKPDFLERLIKSTIEPLRPSPLVSSLGLYPRYVLDGYLSGFLQDQDRSRLVYCDPEFQHIYICRQFLSLLDRSNVFDLHL